MSLVFTLDTAGYDYRPLKLGVEGWDVFGVQIALNHFASPMIKIDGAYGERTKTAVTRYQRHRHFDVVDGIAGQLTQVHLALAIIPQITGQRGLPVGGIKGGVTKESGCLFGNHPAQYNDGSWDLALPQINNLHKKVTFAQAFNPNFALKFYEDTIADALNRYSVEDPKRLARLKARGVSDTPLSWRRRVELAFGSWNRPAHTAWLAGQPDNETQQNITGALTFTQRQWIEGYIERVTGLIEW